MWLSRIGVLVVLIQLYFAFRGGVLYGKMVNPFYLFTASVTIPVLYLINTLKDGATRVKTPSSKAVLATTLALGAAAAAYIIYHYHQAFITYYDMGKYSDVNLQIEALYDRFVRGEQPYYPLPLNGWSPFPAYMPAHWLILAIPKWLHKDWRWIGVFMLLAGYFWMIVQMYRKGISPINQIACALLIPYVLYNYQIWGGAEIFATFEPPVAAFYLLVAIGLQTERLAITAAGILLCMLSRYTILFWLPVFALILLHERPLKTSLYLWGAVITGILLIYVFPFLLKEPDMLQKAVTYHNKAAIDEWQGYGNPPVSWSHEYGIYFAPHFKAFFTGDMTHRVWMMRAVQGSLMILLNMAGYIGYRKWRSRINPFEYSLVMLYVILVFFYAFGPLTYRYYLITPFCLGIFIVSLAIYNRGKQPLTDLRQAKG